MTIQTTRYYRSLLSDKEQKAYDALYEAFITFAPSATVSCQVKDALSRIFKYLVLDNPLLFYADFSSISYGVNPIRGTLTIHVDYVYSQHDARRIISEIEHKCKEITSLMATAPSVVNGYQKALWLHDWMASNISYGNNSQGSYSQHSIVGALVSGSGVCDGYAKMYKLLCEMSGVTCVVAAGKSSGVVSGVNGNHAWNILRVENACAHVDVTWDSNLTSMLSSGKVSGFAAHNYFLLSDSEASVTHHWDTNCAPRCSGSSLQNYFDRNGLNANSTEQYFALCCKQIRNGNRCFQIKLKNVAASERQLDELTGKAILSVGGSMCGGRMTYCYSYDQQHGIMTVQS